MRQRAVRAGASGATACSIAGRIWHPQRSGWPARAPEHDLPRRGRAQARSSAWATPGSTWATACCATTRCRCPRRKRAGCSRSPAAARFFSTAPRTASCATTAWRTTAWTPTATARTAAAAPLAPRRPTGQARPSAAAAAPGPALPARGSPPCGARQAPHACAPLARRRSRRAGLQVGRRHGATAHRATAPDRGKAARAPRAAGSADWQGMAPAAKLAFQDLGAGPSGTIDLGGDLATDYYPYTYARSDALYSQHACAAFTCLVAANSGPVHGRGRLAQHAGDAPPPCHAAECARAYPRTGATSCRADHPVKQGRRACAPRTPGNVLLGLQDTHHAQETNAQGRGWSRPRRGARVHSDSWGTATPDYDGLALDVDTFAWARLHTCFPTLTAFLRCLFTSGASTGRASKFTPHPVLCPPGAPRVRVSV
jgi:hypothetical protein